MWTNNKQEQKTDLYAGNKTAPVSKRSKRWKLLPRHIPIAIKLAIAIGILLTIAMTMLGALLVNNQTRLLNDHTNSTGRTIIQQMAESAKELLLANDVLQLEILSHNLTASENIVGSAVYSTDHKLLTSSGQNPFQRYAPFAGQYKKFLDGKSKTLQWQWDQSPTGTIDAISFMMPVHFKDVTAGHVLISFSREAMTESIDKSVASIITVTALLIFLGIGLSYFLGHRLTRPIQRLLDVSRAIDDGHYDGEIASKRNDEIGFLMNSLNGMAKGLIEKEQVEAAFNRHVSPNIAKEILSNLDSVKLGGQHVFSTVMFIDIVGFTAKSETLSPQAVAELLNEFYSYINSSVHLYKGSVDKYIGDCAMIIFGVPEPDKDHCYHAMSYAVFLQRLAERVNNIRISKGKFPVHYSIGINSGEMLAGNMGSETHMQYTVVGDSVNLASRLASLANTDQIMITEENYRLPGIRERIIAAKYQSMHIRGKADAVTTYLIHDVMGAEQIKMELQIDRILAAAGTIST